MPGSVPLAPCREGDQSLPGARRDHQRLEVLLELVDGLDVVGPGHQALHQPLAGVPVLGLVVQDEAEGRRTGPSVIGLATRRWRT